MENFELFDAFAKKILGKPLSSVKPQWLTGWQVIEALWLLNDVFRPLMARLQTVEYNMEHEADADAAIALLANNINAWSDIEFSAGVLRVLLERHLQMLVVAGANEIAGNIRFMPIPPGFTQSQITVAAMLFFLHGMKLPQLPADRSGFEIPAGSAQESLRLH